MSEIDSTRERLEIGPRIDPSAFVAAGVQITGDVRLAPHSSVWYNAVLRGDINYITVGEASNVQDGAILHVESEGPCILQDRVTVGHRAIVHASVVETGCLIGMGAIILSGSRIGRGSIVAAGSVVLENTVVEPFSLMAGVPARPVRRLEEQSLLRNFERAEKYIWVSAAHRARG